MPAKANNAAPNFSMTQIEQSIANRSDDSLIAVNDLITVREVRKLVDENRVLREANAAFLARLLEDREGRLIRVPTKDPKMAPDIMFFPAGSIDGEVPK